MKYMYWHLAAEFKCLRVGGSTVLVYVFPSNKSKYRYYFTVKYFFNCHKNSSNKLAYFLNYISDIDIVRVVF